MKFLIDAQLPRRLCRLFSTRGHVALHTLDLPLRNASPDSNIIQVADSEGWIVVTKDSDFVDSFLLRGRPQKLLSITTGNIKNSDLENLLEKSMTVVEKAFENHRYVELDNGSLIIHV